MLSLIRSEWLVAIGLLCLTWHSPAYAMAVLDGAKLTDQGNAFTAPGATVSLRTIGGVYGPSFGPLQPRFTTKLAAGRYEVGIQVPDGFDAFISVCVACTANAPASFTRYAQPLLIDVPQAGHIGLQVSFRPAATGDNRQAETGQTLVCNYPGLPDQAPATDSMLFKGSDAWARVGINRAIGGIGVRLDLINPARPDQPLQIIDSRSIGGAAWQSSFGVADDATNRIIHYDQAAGNSARVWGYTGAFEVQQGHGFTQTDWSPLFSNDYRTQINFTAASVNTSPCYHTGFRLGDGRAALTATLLPAGTGQVVQLSNAYSVRHATEQSWRWLQVDQGIYMSLAAVRQGALRIFLVQPRSAGGRIAGPINPYDNFAANSRANIRALICNEGDCMISSPPISYAVLVWHVLGRDIAMAIHLRDPEKTYYGYIRLRTNMLCRTGADACGNLQFHARIQDGNFDRTVPTGAKAGEIDTYEVLYDVGTPAQLAQRGFPVTDGSR